MLVFYSERYNSWDLYKTRKYNQAFKKAFKSYLEANGIQYDFNKQTGYLKFSIKLKGKFPAVGFWAKIEEMEYSIYAYSTLANGWDGKVNYRNLLNFIIKSNNKFLDKKTVMSFDHGVVEYRATMKCNGVVPSQRMIEASIQYPVVLLECFGEGIAIPQGAVCIKGTDPDYRE